QVTLDVDRPEHARRLLTRAGWRVNSNGGHRLAVAANGRSDAALLNAQLVGQGVNVYRLALERPTLEDIFLTLTNQALPG
ncbi:MAG: ABC transporter ATP-binding protein, partial [Anaerolineae bacterium]|nr:ABC transporter ATP-binding protein [Anaerolineae bacterium]